MGEGSSGGGTGRVALLSAVITGSAAILAAVIPVLIGAVHVSTSPVGTVTVTATPSTTVTVTAPSSSQSGATQGQQSEVYPGAGSGGVVRNLSAPLVGTPAYMSIDFDTGAVTESSGGEQAYYQMISDTNVPELQINVPYSLDVNDGNASKSQCSTVTKSNPVVQPVTGLSKGKLICIQGFNGIGLLEVMRTVRSASSTLYLRETYWPTSSG